MKLHIAGGFYREVCGVPRFKEHFGSGLRATAALHRHGVERHLHTYATKDAQRNLDTKAATFGFDYTLHHRSQPIAFSYDHPLGTPEIWPAPNRIAIEAPFEVQGEAVLRFGFLEGSAKVSGDRVVYDPQSAFDPVHFEENGSQAKELALVLNRGEALRLTGSASLDEAAQSLLKRGVAVAVIKDGAEGAFVYESSQATANRVCAYRTPHVFKIGSGDVYSAFFALNWAVLRKPPVEAAALASLATACYCCEPALPVPTDYAGREFPKLREGGLAKIEPHEFHVYLAGPFFTTAQMWMINQARSILRSSGLRVFSPYHEVGIGDAGQVAGPDLAGLDVSHAVFAFIDGFDAGTVFELGYARAKSIPLFAVAENVKEEDLKMIVGSGGRVFSDFTTAIYHLLWKLRD
ncbi:MAG: nucleoside 2-deoxyribosyltransferase [Verrucomicrobia bacterium]|nr:nucleoside 2-deoxyribosyltransferase [Verrucomicrobiota bacterium]